MKLTPFRTHFISSVLNQVSSSYSSAGLDEYLSYIHLAYYHHHNFLNLNYAVIAGELGLTYSSIRFLKRSPNSASLSRVPSELQRQNVLH